MRSYRRRYPAGSGGEGADTFSVPDDYDSVCGETSGTFRADMISVNGATVALPVEVWLVDERGNESNHLTGETEPIEGD